MIQKKYKYDEVSKERCFAKDGCVGVKSLAFQRLFRTTLIQPYHLGLECLAATSMRKRCGHRPLSANDIDF